MNALASHKSVAPPVNGDDGTPGFGIYIHWPFCAAKCPYCDFNSHVRHRPVDQPRFVGAFRREMETMRGWTGPRDVTSVFIGGGTPSLMQPQTVGALLEAADDLWGLPAGIEITLEANPSSADAGRFAGYRAAGVNRLSLGVQALNDADLKFLGRLHNVGGSAEGHRHGARDLPAPFLRPDLCPPRPDTGSLGSGTARGHGPCRRPSVALSAHHRGRHALQGAS
jgi:coproporphyrinogen III oxidase-like Fe-S oxidoreductase